MTLRGILKELKAAVRQARLLEGDGVRLEFTESGSRIHVEGIGGGEWRPGGSSMLPARIASGGPGTSYSGDLFGDGPEAPATVTGVAIRILHLDPAETVPPGTWLLVTPLGGEYLGQVPVWT